MQDKSSPTFWSDHLACHAVATQLQDSLSASHHVAEPVTDARVTKPIIFGQSGDGHGEEYPRSSLLEEFCWFDVARLLEAARGAWPVFLGE